MSAIFFLFLLIVFSLKDSICSNMVLKELFMNG